MTPNNLNKLILILALILLFTNLFFIDLSNPKAILSDKKVILNIIVSLFITMILLFGKTKY